LTAFLSEAIDEYRVYNRALTQSEITNPASH
jgi:hypothetical protein